MSVCSGRAARDSRTLPGLGSRVAARGAGVLLDVEGATTCSSISRVLYPCFCSFAEPFHCISVKVLRVRHTATPAERVRLVVTLSE